eukprot:1445889-Prorocentrum_lima.AAC.1
MLPHEQAGIATPDGAGREPALPEHPEKSSQSFGARNGEHIGLSQGMDGGARLAPAMRDKPTLHGMESNAHIAGGGVPYF